MLGRRDQADLNLFAHQVASLIGLSALVDQVLLEALRVDPRSRRGLFIAATIAHDRMNLANNRGDQAEELEYAASAASLIERFMSTRPTERHDLYSMRYFYVNIAGAYYDARQFDHAIRYCKRGLDIQLPGPDPDAMRGGTLGVLAAARWQSGDLDGALIDSRII